MYDSLLDEDPYIQERDALAEARGKAKGEAESRAKGEIEGWRTAIVTIVKARFPQLAESAQQRVSELKTSEALEFLLNLIVAAPDEDHIRWLLQPPA